MPKSTPPWHIFIGDNQCHPSAIDTLSPPPPWRSITTNAHVERGSKHQFAKDSPELDAVNAALILRRPLLITGKPGTGKSSLAYAIAFELGLEPVLVWNITSRTALQDGLYRYDAIGRLNDTAHQERTGLVAAEPAIGDYIRLGPLGTAFLPLEHQPLRPRVLLIDEIDKSDIDLPNDLLNILEECSFEIPEIARFTSSNQRVNPHAVSYSSVLPDVVVTTADSKKASLPANGRVSATAFPIIIMTSNDERQFPPAFLRRCIPLAITPPDKETLERIVEERVKIGAATDPRVQKLIADFLKEREAGTLTGATDHLLNAAFLILHDVPMEDVAGQKESLRRLILQSTPAGSAV